MNSDLVALIPDSLLREAGTPRLREWLQERGVPMSLLDLEKERLRRGMRSTISLTPQTRRRTGRHNVPRRTQ